MKWFRRHAPEPPPTPHLDEQLAKDKAERETVAALRPESERLARQMAEHQRKNHFAERLLAEAMNARRGKHA